MAEDAKMKIKTSANYLATWTKIPLMMSKNDSYSQTHWEPKTQLFGLIGAFQWVTEEEHTILGVLSWKLTTIAQAAKTIQLENSSHPKRSDKSQTKYCQQKAGKSRQNKYRLISAKADITGTSRHSVHHWNIRESYASVEHQDILDITGTSGHHSSITQSKQAIWSITHIFCKIKSSPYIL